LQLNLQGETIAEVQCTANWPFKNGEIKTYKIKTSQINRGAIGYPYPQEAESSNERSVFAATFARHNE